MQNESYNIFEITDGQIWDDFVTSQQNHTFLHSWAWGEFNEAMGDKIWRFGAYKIASRSPQDRLKIASSSGGLSAAALVIKVHARRGNFLFVPHGPVGDKDSFSILLDKIKELAKHEKVNFIRISPLLQDSKESRCLFMKLGFRSAPIHMHAETTWALDLTPGEDELLMDMRKTTRNLIRRAIKDGVEIKTGASDKDLEVFYGLYRETVKKHHFTPFSLTFIKKQIGIFSGIDGAQIFTAWYNGKAIASAMIVFYGNSAFYHHGASIPSRIPAAYLLQWEAILEAKRRGYKFYNFWGVVGADAATNHPWQGITLFKKGFGGFQTDYLHAQDLPISWKYWPNYIFEKIRKKRRRL